MMQKIALNWLDKLWPSCEGLSKRRHDHVNVNRLTFFDQVAKYFSPCHFSLKATWAGNPLLFQLNFWFISRNKLNSHKKRSVQKNNFTKNQKSFYINHKFQDIQFQCSWPTFFDFFFQNRKMWHSQKTKKCYLDKKKKNEFLHGWMRIKGNHQRMSFFKKWDLTTKIFRTVMWASEDQEIPRFSL